MADRPAGSGEGPFEGLRVLECGRRIAGRLAGLLLAEYGAEVVRLEPHGGDADQNEPPFHYYNRSKQRLEVDFADRAAIAALVRSADVLIVEGTPGRLRSLGLDYATVAAAHPGIIHVAIPPFGERGPMAEIDGDEWVVAAFGGVMAGQASDDGAPTYILAPLAGTSAGMLAAGAVAVALRHRERAGGGQSIVVSLLTGAMAVLGHDYVDSPAFAKDRWYHSNPRGPSPPFGLFEAKDGRWLALAVLNDKFWRNFCHVIGHDDWAAGLTMEGVNRADPSDNRRAWLMPRLVEAIASRPLEEWLPLITGADIPAGAVNTYKETLRDPQTVHNAIAVEIDDPALGPTRQVGLPVRFARTPGAIRGPSTRARELWWPPRTPRTRGGVADGEAPLKGIRVVDFGSYIAGTYIGLLMADLGADVLKIESLAGDSFRGTEIDFLSWNRGKRSASLDLRHEPCRAAVARLIEGADVVVENLRPGGIAKLGFDYATVSAKNPRIVYASLSAFGQTGPRHTEPGFDLLGQAFAGGPDAQGGDDGPLYHTAAYADYGASMLAFFGVMTALYERERSGLGQQIDTSLADGALMFHAGRAMEVDGRSIGQRGARHYRGPSPYRRLYRASDGWLYLDAAGETGRQEALHRVLGQAISEWERRLAAEPRAAWLARLADASVIAVPADPPWEVLRHEQLAANELVSTQDDPVYGPASQAAPILHFSRTPAIIQRRAPLLGEHTREILRLAGWDEGEIEAAIREGAVGESGGP